MWLVGGSENEMCGGGCRIEVKSEIRKLRKLGLNFLMRFKPSYCVLGEAQLGAGFR
jgi:hypothetical protein